MLIRNYKSIYNVLGRQHSGATSPTTYLNPSTMRNFFTQDDATNIAQIKKDSFPTATEPPYSIVLSEKGGLLSSTTQSNGSGTIVSNMAMGKYLSSTLAGSGDLTSNMTLIVQLISTLMGSGDLSASMVGTLQMAANLAGSGDITSSLSLLANITANLIGSGAITGNLKGFASMEADITPYTDLSPENLAAAVWNALAASYNSVGTMGEKMNDAGSASNPWTEIIEGGYTAAECLRLLTAVAAGKTTIVDLGGGLATVTFRDINDTVDRVEADMTNSERTNVTKKLI